MKLPTVDGASALCAASFIKMDIVVGFIYFWKVKCLEQAEIVYGYCVRLGDRTAVSVKITAFWDITSCNAGK
jgi:hypothetical protein